MPTTPPTTPSPLETTNDAQLEETLKDMHEKLKGQGVSPDLLVVALLTSNDMVFGEVASGEGMEEDGESIMGRYEFVSIRNPKRLTRMVMLSQRGEMNVQIVFSDFDFVNKGVVEVRPVGCFLLKWLDTVSQVNYCGAYLNFEEGRRLAMLEQRGITMASPGDLLKLRPRG